MRRSRDNRGLALILVLTVILALAIIATPFVLSMLKQERGAIAMKAASKSDYGAEGAKNWAAYLAMLKIDPMERRMAGTPYNDNWPEFIIPPTDSRLALDANTVTGTLWGMTLQDEQGKLNIRTVPERVLTTLRALVDVRIHDVRDYITQYSVRDARWIFPQRVRSVGQITIPGGGTINNGVLVDNAAHFGPQSRLKFSRAGTTTFETRVTINYLFSSGVNVIETEEAVPTSFQNGVVEVELRHPVNICAARKETLIAMFTGVGMTLGGTSDEISIDEARAVADITFGKQYDNFVDWALDINNLTQLSPLDKSIVIANALDPTLAALNGTGTVPACFVNMDTVTVEGRAVTNTKAGAPIAKSRFRQVIDLAPPVAIARQLISQYDFDQRMNAAVIAAGGFGAYFNYYPWGARFQSAPNVPPNPSDRTFTAQVAHIQLRHADMYKGYSQFSNLLQPTERFPNELEGLQLNGASQPYVWNRVLTTNNNPPAPQALQNLPDNTAGGIELWVRFDTIANPTQILNIRESDTCNRISLRYETGNLVFTVTDFTLGDTAVPLDKGWAEIRHPFQPLAETWYHIGAYWKGTRYGHLALLVDGYSDPNSKWSLNDEDGRKNETELSADLAQAATGMSIKDNSWIPDPTLAEPGPVPLLIGNEVVEYDKPTGTIFRGARNTAAQFHPRGTKVTLFGYSSRLQPLQVDFDLTTVGLTGVLSMLFDRLPRVNGRVLYDFGANPTAQVQGDKGSMPTYIDASQNYVPTQAAILDFPQKGYIRIGDEIIYYDSINTTVTPNRFENCARGQHGSIAAQHNTGAQIRLWCVPTTNTTNYLSPTIIQIGNEWIGPVQRDTVRPTFFIGVMSGTTPLPMLRGIFGSGGAAHTTTEDILPLFAARETDMGVNRHNVRGGERITLTDATNNKEMHRIRRASLAQGPFQFNMNDTQLAGLQAQVVRDYVPDQLHVRIGKFPSGELIGLNWLQTANPNFEIGPANLTIDEIKFYGSPKGNFACAVAVNDVGGTVTVNGAGGMSQAGGALKIGDEIVGYVNVSGNNLNKCRRGWLNSPAQQHDVGDLAFNMSFLPIAALVTDMSDTDALVQLSQPLVGEPGYTSGYVVIDQEVIGFEWTAGGNRQLRMPTDFNSIGLWRAAFGTQRRTHTTDALVYGIPFRYRDSYRTQAWDNLMPYYQASWTIRGARWRSINWTDEVALQDPNVVVHCIVRCDGVGNFWDPPGQSDQQLIWEFVKGGTYPIMHRSLLRDAGQLDARFYVEYVPGSYWPAHSWKRTPRIREVNVEYDREMKAVFHEEK